MQGVNLVMQTYFLDTNLIIYWTEDNAKRDRVEELLAGDATISVQVLTEFANAMRNKRKLDFEVIEAFSSTLQKTCEVRELTTITHGLALKIAARYKLSVYDAQIAASAMLAECPVLYTEDMHHGLSMSITYKKREFVLSVRNPFL